MKILLIQKFKGEWNEILKAKYLRLNPIMEYFLSSDQISIGSTIRNNVTGAKGIVNLGKVWAIGNGRRVDFWDDARVGGAPVNDHYVPQVIIQACKNKFGVKVVDYRRDQKWVDLSTTYPTLKNVNLNLN
ncbi:hypothetical protein SUGI_0076510 [Cryptomeria japonica]|nr:hypothetical protein SUGI_0076510 [Cryptomeria japonica]